MFSQLKIFIQLTRLNKPIGIMLLFWPCSWGLAYSSALNISINQFLYYLLLFFLGSVLMRSAGCIVNDIVDKDFDKKIKRAKMRPLAAKKITVKKASIYAIILCLIAFIILIQFNQLTIFLGLASMILAFSYPFMKRITFWPQLFLGLTFNWGIIMAWTSINNSLSLEIMLLYLSAIFWTIGYDTIYGTQDIKDDEIIGLKSTSIKFKKKLKVFVGFNYFLFLSLQLYIFKSNLGLNFFSLLCIILLLSLMVQLLVLNKKKPQSCLFAFKLNNISGFLLFLIILQTNFIS